MKIQVRVLAALAALLILLAAPSGAWAQQFTDMSAALPGVFVSSVAWGCASNNV